MASEAPSRSAWRLAADLVARWLERRERLDVLLSGLPSNLPGSERARCQHLLYGVVRHFGRIEAALDRLIAHRPRNVTRGVLFIAGLELLEAQLTAVEDGKTAKIVHHAMEQTKAMASPPESRLVNAVARKLGPQLENKTPSAEAPAAELAEFFSHPTWVVERWMTQFGREATVQLLQWNQQPALVHARWRRTGATPYEFLRPTRWENFFEIGSGNWPAITRGLEAGEIYLQDPSTRAAVDLLAPKPQDKILDLCAAPGGKSLLIADQWAAHGNAEKRENAEEKKTGMLVAVDKPGARVERLKENLARTHGAEVALVQADMIEDLPKLLRTGHGLPTEYDGVLLDAPCSNSGVVRHRPDVKWRWLPTDFSRHAEQQLTMLHTAARLVARGGRLVYSTCSIDSAENEDVVKNFLRGRAGNGFTLENSVVYFPWRDEHDGAGAFLLQRRE